MMVSKFQLNEARISCGRPLHGSQIYYLIMESDMFKHTTQNLIEENVKGLKKKTNPYANKPTNSRLGMDENSKVEL